MDPKETKWEEGLITLKYKKYGEKKRTPDSQKRWPAHTKNKASKSDLRRYASIKSNSRFCLYVLPTCLDVKKMERPFQKAQSNNAQRSIEKKVN